ncbi:hypothetical protein TNCV_1782191 [Trichonephila clavipes]|nr:hypothetical protein TNCV_1782191 [Trichonephila clavipes]
MECRLQKEKLSGLSTRGKSEGLLVPSELFLMSSAHQGHATQYAVQHLKWDASDPPTYRPDLAPSDFHLFPEKKGQA